MDEADGEDAGGADGTGRLPVDGHGPHTSAAAAGGLRPVEPLVVVHDPAGGGGRHSDSSRSTTRPPR